MTGPLEPTNESYAVAKIVGIRLAQAKHQEHGVRIAMANQQTKTNQMRTATTNTQPLPRLKTQIALETY